MIFIAAYRAVAVPLAVDMNNLYFANNGQCVLCVDLHGMRLRREKYSKSINGGKGMAGIDLHRKAIEALVV